MGFYIRKSFRAGPIRLNLSKSGLGVSAGVKGFRVGSGPRGSYVHAGRKGLYYRQSLGSGKRGKITSTSNSGCLVVVGVIIGVAAISWIVQWFSQNVIVFFGLVGAGIAVGGTKLFVELQKGRRIERVKTLLDACFVTGTKPIDEDALEKVRKLRQKLGRNQKTGGRVAEIEKSVYEAVLDKILDDRAITPEETSRLESLESVAELDETFKCQSKKEVFSLFYLEVVEDRTVTASELATLNNLISGLKLKKEEIQEEVSTVNEIIRMQKLKPPLPQVKEVPIKMQKSEIAYYATSARVLSRKKARKASDSEYEYSVRRDGHFVITNKRVLVVDEGTTAVKLSDIVDVEVDLDKKMLMISKGSSGEPTLITTAEPLFAGKVIDLLIQHPV